MDKDIKDLAKTVMKNAPKQPPHRNVKTEGQLIFGPYVPLCKVHDSLITGLLKRGEKLTPGDKNSTLAGQLKDQRGYTMEDKEWYIKEFAPYVEWYLEGALKWSQQKYDPKQHTKSFKKLENAGKKV